MAQTTKKALAASLKKLMEEKPLDKITVVDLAEECEVNRQTFYYHFKDIYDLAEWVFTSETMKVVEENKSYDTWQEGYLYIFEYIRQNRRVMVNAYHSGAREFLTKFLYEQTYRLLIDVIEEKAQNIQVREEDKSFIAQFYKYGFVGLVLDWIENGMKEKPEKIVERLGCLIEGDVSKALERFCYAGKK
ncbi:MAG: TetR/AcrR family transcriptional regulator [Lachnospiraceae bacterium]